MLPHLNFYKSSIYLLLICFGLSSINKVSSQGLSVQEKDALYLSNPWKDIWEKIHIKKTYLQVGLQYSIEKVNTTAYQSPFIYASNYDEAFPIGVKIGASWDITYNKQNLWSIHTYLNYQSSKIKQIDTEKFSPLISNYYAYPIKNASWYAGMQLFYKIPLFNSNNEMARIHWLIGPGFDFQISPQNIDQKQYKKANYYFLTGNTGFEYLVQHKKRIGFYYQFGRNTLNSQIKAQLAAWQFNFFIPIEKKSCI
ncbi:MAG: hypothetical protein RL188_397 [Bacteroidota bacterium]